MALVNGERQPVEVEKTPKKRLTVDTSDLFTPFPTFDLPFIFGGPLI